MNILLIPNLDKKNAFECTCDAIQRLSDCDSRCYLFCDVADTFKKWRVFSYNQQEDTQIDLIISIGGDGTLIHSARHAVALDCPVLGINAGRLGFLTEMEYTALDQLKEVVRGNYTIQPRMMLHAEVKKESGNISFSALNDVVISRGEHEWWTSPLKCKTVLSTVTAPTV